MARHVPPLPGRGRPSEYTTTLQIPRRDTELKPRDPLPLEILQVAASPSAYTFRDSSSPSPRVSLYRVLSAFDVPRHPRPRFRVFRVFLSRPLVEYSVSYVYEYVYDPSRLRRDPLSLIATPFLHPLRPQGTFD